MQNQMKLRYYLDTSAINKIEADPQWDDATYDALLKVADFHFSALNIAEIAATPDVEKRFSLMRVVHKLSNDLKPLALPSELLKRSLIFFEEVRVSEHRGLPPPDRNRYLSVEGGEAGFWALVKNPELVREPQVHSEMVELKSSEEKQFRSFHDDLRPKFQEIREQNGDPYRTGAGLIRYFRGPFNAQDMEDAFQTSFTGIADDMGVKFGGDAHAVFNRLEAWSFYFGAMVHALYNRVISTGRFGYKTNPGAIDTKQAIYLVACDRFVTADIKSRQYRVIRVVNKLGLIPRRVLRFDEFGAMLL